MREGRGQTDMLAATIETLQDMDARERGHFGRSEVNAGSPREKAEALRKEIELLRNHGRARARNLKFTHSPASILALFHLPTMSLFTALDANFNTSAHSLPLTPGTPPGIHSGSCIRQLHPSMNQGERE